MMLLKHQGHDSDEHVQDCDLCEESRADEIKGDQDVLKDHRDFLRPFKTIPAAVKVGLEVTQDHSVLEEEGLGEQIQVRVMIVAVDEVDGLALVFNSIQLD